MTNILFLLPPSEGKKPEGNEQQESLTYSMDKPYDIAKNATEKDLKCTGKRYDEGLGMNKKIGDTAHLILPAIHRYSGVMYNAISYSDMSKNGKKFFDDNFLILSGMYGLLRPLDMIGNYKLPIETKGLYDFWGEEILETINAMNIEYIVNLLPISYAKLIYGKNKTLEREFTAKRKFQIINVNFLKPDGSKMAHGVKKIKGEWIHNICNKKISNYRDFGGKIIEKGDQIVDVNITID